MSTSPGLNVTAWCHKVYCCWMTTYKTTAMRHRYASPVGTAEPDERDVLACSDRTAETNAGAGPASRRRRGRLREPLSQLMIDILSYGQLIRLRGQL